MLFVDDDERVHTLLRRLFTHAQVEFDYDFQSATGGALSMLNTFCYDAVVLDYKLPDFTGSSAADEIRKVYPNMPLAYMTNYSADDVLEDAHRLRVHLWPPKIRLMGDTAELMRLTRELLAEHPCEDDETPPPGTPPQGTPERRGGNGDGGTGVPDDTGERRRASDPAAARPHRLAHVSPALQRTLLTPLNRRASFHRGG